VRPDLRYNGVMSNVHHADADGVLFEAVIVPHRSLSRRGLWLLIGVICGACTLTGLRFWLLGAWPVLAFTGIEVGLAVLLLRINARRARATELLLLSADALRVVRTNAAGGRQERVLSPAWLNVVLEDRPGRVPKLLLAARETREEVGASLGEAEKRDLAAALRTALHDLRNPRFNNLQLQ
jgi:uncharacterized membrane protein